MTTTTAPSTWLTFREVCRHVRAAANVVRARMNETEASPVENCWINRGTAARVIYSFTSVDEVNRWWGEINKWRASENSRAGRSDGKSDGASPTARGPRRAPRPKQPARSSGESSTPKTSATTTGPTRALLTSHWRAG